MRRLNLFVTLFFITPFFFIACTEDESDLGLGLQDPSSIFNGKVFDTTTVVAYTVFDDSLLTSNYATGVIGYYQDNVFGKVEGYMYTQASVSTSGGVSFENTEIDSVVLSLICVGVYPSSLNTSKSIQNLHFQVYAMSEGIELDSSYYASDSRPTGACYFDNTIQYNPSDSLIRMKLSSNIHSVFENQIYKDNSSFIEAFKGMFIKMVPNWASPCMLYINYWASVTGITVHYRDAETTKPLTYRFVFNKSAAHFNQYVQDYSGTALSVFNVDKKATIEGTQKLYLESLGGTSIKLNFPNLIEWGKQHPNAIIHQAELFLPFSEASPDNDPPSQVICYKYTRSGTIIPIADMTDGILGKGFDGSYNTSQRYYRMRITRHIQQMLNGTIGDYGLRIYVNARRTTANRCIINGTQTSNPVKLKIIYTE